MRRAASALALVLGLPFAREAHACLEARHAFAYVLGSSARGVVVLELDLKRTGEEDVRWVGPVRVGVQTAPGAPLTNAKALASVDEGSNSPDQAIRERLVAGAAAARAFAGFRPAGLPRYTSCDYQRACDRFALSMEKGHSVLTIAGATPVKVPLAIPPALVQSASVDKSPEEFATDMGLVSVLSYDVGGREVLVVDLGFGETPQSWLPDATWPPCGCTDVQRCPPVAMTMHHASQFQVVIPLPTPRPRATSAAPPAASSGETRLRTDGVYAAEATCRPPEGWKRQFLRFGTDGKVRSLEANLTPRGAFLVLGNDHFVFENGKYKVKGDSVSAKLTADSDDEYVDRIVVRRLRATLSGDTLTEQIRSAKVVYRFIEVK